MPDDRLKAIAGVIHPERLVPATVQFIDIAGLVQGAATGEGLGNRFLSHIREVTDRARARSCGREGDLDPVRDAELVETELALADLETVEHAVDRARGRAKSGDTARARARPHRCRRWPNDSPKGFPCDGRSSTGRSPMPYASYVC